MGGRGPAGGAGGWRRPGYGPCGAGWAAGVCEEDGSLGKAGGDWSGRTDGCLSD